MSSIVRVTDIGRPGLLVYMPGTPSASDAAAYDFMFWGLGPTSTVSTGSTTLTKVDSGTFTIPSKAWAYPATAIYHLFLVTYTFSTKNYAGDLKIVLDGAEITDSLSSNSSVTRSVIIRKIPSTVNVPWELWLRTWASGGTASGRIDSVYYCPVWVNNILYCKNIGANVLLTRVILKPGTMIRIDDEYVYRNTGSSDVILDFNMLPFYKIEFSGSPWAKIEYVRVE